MWTIQSYKCRYWYHTASAGFGQGKGIEGHREESTGECRVGETGAQEESYTIPS